MIHIREFKHICECGEPLSEQPEPGDYVADGCWIGLDFDGAAGGKLPETGVKYWRCTECGERTWVYGFPLVKQEG